MATAAELRAAELEKENAAMKAQIAAAPKVQTKQDNSAARTVASIGITIDDKPAIVGMAPHRKFNTGSLGYQLFGKIWLDGVQYQCNLLLVEIDSKPSK